MPYIGLLMDNKTEIKVPGYRRICTDDIQWKMSPPLREHNRHGGRCHFSLINVTPLKFSLGSPVAVPWPIGCVAFLGFYEHADSADIIAAQRLTRDTGVVWCGDLIQLDPGSLVFTTSLESDFLEVW